MKVHKSWIVFVIWITAVAIGIIAGLWPSTAVKSNPLQFAPLTVTSGGLATNKGSFTRPADTTAYASGDLVANSTTAGSVVAPTMQVSRGVPWSGSLRRARIQKSTTSVTNAQFRVHVYQTATGPTVTNGDNGAWLSNSSQGYIGSFDVTVDRAFSDGATGVGAPTTGGGTELNFTLQATDELYVLLEARAAYTPGNAEVFTIYLEQGP